MVPTETCSEASILEATAADEIEAALSEATRGSSPFSIGLLLEAAQKERKTLDAIEESLESLRISLEKRRRAIDQQEEALRDLSEALIQARN